MDLLNRFKKTPPMTSKLVGSPDKTPIEADGGLNLSKDEYEKFLDAAENHQRAVVEAILKGDAVNRSTPSQVDIQWKDENTHKKIHVNDIRIQHQNLERHIRSSLELHQQKSL